MIDDLIYSLVFLLVGMIAVLWSKSAPKTKGDPFLIKIGFISSAATCFFAAIYLFIKFLSHA